MKINKFYTTSLLLLFTISSFAQIPAGYYDGAAGLEGYTLKSELHSIISTGHSSNGYGALYNGYKTTDSDNYYENDGSVLDMYSENPGGADPYYYTHNNNTCGTYDSEYDCYNREHIVPQSVFSENTPMVDDIHHVVPTDGYVNNRRSNYAFGEVSSPTWTSLNGSKVGSNTYGSYSGTVFEPIDEFKGDIARMLFYFATRYETQVDSWSHTMFNGTENQVFEDWFLSLIMTWHNNDPVNQREIDRNNASYNYQGNRNPFIDYPEWVECIWGSNCNGSISFTSTPVKTALTNQTYTYDITYAVNLETETISCTTKPAWLSFSSNTSSNTAQLLGSPSGTDIGTHSIVLELTEDGTTVNQNFSIEVGSDLVIDIINEEFTTCPATGWTNFSVSGSKDWECGTTNASMYINAFDGDAPSNDWMISPEINFNDYTGEILTFDTYTKYTDGGITNPEVRLFYSVNYTGSGNPEDVSWTELSYNFPNEDSQAQTTSGNVDLSAISGSAGHIAFVYTSSGNGVGTSALWEVDNILLTGEQSSGSNTLPEFTSTPGTTATQGTAYSYSISASDTDGDDLSFEALTKPTWLTLTDNNNGTASLSGTPGAGDAGSNSVSVSVSDGTGNATQEFTISVTGTGSINNQNNLVQIYPNPAFNEISVVSTHIISNIRISNIIGKEVYQLNDLNTNNTKVDLTYLSGGIYFVEITDVNNIKTLKKLIKE